MSEALTPTPTPPRLAKCGHVAYRNHDDMCIQDGCSHAAYQPPGGWDVLDKAFVEIEAATGMSRIAFEAIVQRLRSDDAEAQADGWANHWRTVKPPVKTGDYARLAAAINAYSKGWDDARAYYRGGS